MSLGREILGEYVRHRLYGERRRHRRGLGRVFRPRRRQNVEVSSCGCCLPIPIGVLTASGLGLRLLLRSRS